MSNDIPCVGNASAHPHDRRDKRTEFVTIRVSLATKDQLLAIAQQRERSLSWLANSILERVVSEQVNERGK